MELGHIQKQNHDERRPSTDPSPAERGYRYYHKVTTADLLSIADIYILPYVWFRDYEVGMYIREFVIPRAFDIYRRSRRDSTPGADKCGSKYYTQMWSR